MAIRTSRELLAVDLRSYGEDSLAAEIAKLPQERLEAIFERADDYLSSVQSTLLAKALALAAVEVLEGEPRELRRKRRRLKGVWPGY